MKKRLFVLALLAISILAACSGRPAQIEEQDALATVVAGTLAAVPADESPPGTAKPEASDTPATADTTEPRSIPAISMQDYLLAYTQEGDLWTLRPDGTTSRLTASGDVVKVLLSDDREVIVYLRQSLQPDFFEVRAVRLDGSEDRRLLSQETLDALYPLAGALHYLPSQMEFIPGTHTLLFNTRASFEGPGLVKNDDLHGLDVDDGAHTQLLARERGGDFKISPDAENLAVVQPDSIAIADIDGGNLRPDLVTFEPIITYSEFQYYPIPVWALDSSRFGVFIPSSDPLAEDRSGTLWIVPLEGPPRSFTPVQGETFFAQSNGHSLLSPTLETLAFLREDDRGQTNLLLANLDGSAARTYAQGDLSWIGWNPDGTRFVFRRAENQLTVGYPETDPRPLAEGRSLRWLSAEHFLVQAGQHASSTLNLGSVNGELIKLVGPLGGPLTYDIR